MKKFFWFIWFHEFFLPGLFCIYWPALCSYRYTQRYVIGRAVQKYPTRHRQTIASVTVRPHAPDHSRPGQWKVLERSGFVTRSRIWCFYERNRFHLLGTYHGWIKLLVISKIIFFISIYVQGPGNDFFLRGARLIRKIMFSEFSKRGQTIQNSP